MIISKLIVFRVIVLMTVPLHIQMLYKQLYLFDLL